LIVTSTFLTESAKALRRLRRAQQVRARTQVHAQVRFDRSRAEYRTSLSEAALAESRAWRALLDVPGMTAGTAAALCGTSVATVNRRARGARDGD
jgi:DNA-directed RNA polymerase specialized sigma24 family protein